MSLRVLQPPGQGLYLRSRHGAEIPEQGIGPVAGPYRPARSGNAGIFYGAAFAGAGGAQRCSAATGNTGPRAAKQAI